MDSKKIQEIYNSPLVKRVECIIIGTQRDMTHGYPKHIGSVAIEKLLLMRKAILDNMFVLDNQSIKLLTEFNESLKVYVIEARKRCISLLNASLSNVPLDYEIRCKILLSSIYPKEHPVQTNRAKKMWGILSGDVGRYMSIYYDDGFCDICFDNSFTLDENELLYYESLDLPDSRLDEIDLKMKRYCKITEQFLKFSSHYLSYFDLLWVRDFNIELRLDTKYHTCNKKNEFEYDWDKLDYFD